MTARTPVTESNLPDELKWYELDPGQWLVIESPVGTPAEEAQALLDALPESLKGRVLIVVGKAFVLDPDD